MHSIFSGNWWIWFNVFLLLLLALDLKYLRSGKRAPSPHTSVALTLGWVMLALLFALLLYFAKGGGTAITFLTGYVIEASLSIDNLFVFLMIFHSFHVPAKLQTKILMYGILGALIMRLSLIFAGISLINLAEVVFLLFGAFLLITGIVMFRKPRESASPPGQSIVRLLQKYLPITETWQEEKFFIRRKSQLMATPALVVLISLETADLFFALDSVPAVFAVTLDPFIVYSCNALAILGLRSLFFVLKDLLQVFVYLHYAVSLILVFVGLKMLFSPLIEISTVSSLSIIALIVASSIILSCLPHTKAKK